PGTRDRSAPSTVSRAGPPASRTSQPTAPSGGWPARATGQQRKQQCSPQLYLLNKVLPDLSEQLENRLRGHVGLREDGGTGLLQDLQLGEVDRLVGDVEVADARLGGGLVLARDVQAEIGRAHVELQSRGHLVCRLL